tara:strand:+ start:398 stop:592 length:195 start_codon:yes stop_codon:yes gene_type:complete
MEVNELFDKLRKLKNDGYGRYPIRVIEDIDDGQPNYWLEKIDVEAYPNDEVMEPYGEIRLVGKE